MQASFELFLRILLTPVAPGITQLQLSQAASVGRRFVVELERGKESIHVGKLFKVLEVLGIDFELIAPG